MYLLMLCVSVHVMYTQMYVCFACCVHEVFVYSMCMPVLNIRSSCVCTRVCKCMCYISCSRTCL